uniref:G-protein coupled receptors family 1 profile domain-containing protein n=1 Tax=Plectus sambesii TaxID=2011161 RepID=A0A914VCB7_9BILA
MAQKEQRKHSCYKIMLVMTTLDIINLCTSSILSGYYSYNGIQYCCGHETSMRIIGRFALGFFFMYTSTCVLLAFNRFIDFYSDELTERLFGKRRTWYWAAVPLLYGAYFFTPWSTTIVYNSQFDIWIFTQDEIGKKGVIIHTINNVMTAALLFVLYSLICFQLRRYFSIQPTTQSNDAAARRISSMQKQVIVQSVMICSLTVISCLAYVIVQYTDNFPPALYKTTQIIWQIMHGTSP